MDIKVVSVEAVLMPNGELICMGKTLGFIGEGENQIPAKFVEEKKPRALVAEISGGVMTDLHGLPNGWTYEVADWDIEEDEVREANERMIEEAKAQ